MTLTRIGHHERRLKEFRKYFGLILLIRDTIKETNSK